MIGRLTKAMIVAIWPGDPAQNTHACHQWNGLSHERWDVRDNPPDPACCNPTQYATTPARDDQVQVPAGVTKDLHVVLIHDVREW